MLQILIWLGCAILVAQGAQMAITAHASARPDAERSSLVTYAAMVMAACFLAAIVFVFLANTQASAVSTPLSPFTPTT